MEYEKKAGFLDKNGKLQYAMIRDVPGILLDIDAINEQEKTTGYISFFINPNKRIYLDVVYCFDRFRGNGIATQLSNLADYLLKRYSNYLIRGVYMPSQLDTDRIEGITRDITELDSRARNFYHKNGYDLLSLKEYHNNPNKYPYIDIENDFQLSEELVEEIVVKKVQPEKKSPFSEVNGIIIQNDLLNKEASHKILQRIKER